MWNVNVIAVLSKSHLSTGISAAFAKNQETSNKTAKKKKTKTANEVTYVEICVRNLHSRVHCTGIRR